MRKSYKRIIQEKADTQADSQTGSRLTDKQTADR